MGEIDGAFRVVGLSRGGTGAICERDRRRGARGRRRDSHRDAGVAQSSSRTARPGRRARERRRASRADVVVSSLDPRQTFLEAGRRRAICRPTSSTDVERYKFRGSSGKVNLALDGLPDFTCLPGAGASPARRDLDLAERRLHGARLRRREVRRVTRANPYMDIVIPSLIDPSVAPPGKHVMSCFVQYAPYHLNTKAAGTSSAKRSATRS